MKAIAVKLTPPFVQEMRDMKTTYCLCKVVH